MMRWRAALAVALLATAGCATRQTAEVPSALRASIRAGNDAWVTAMQAHDAKTLADTYAEDAVNCNAAGECTHGRAAIEAATAERMAKMPPVAGGSVHSGGLVVDGDLAFEWGSAEVRFTSGQSFSGRYATVWQRQRDGSWKIFRNNGLPPLPALK